MIEMYLLEHLAAFRGSRTLTEASDALHVTPSTLSRSLKKLEETFGVPLFIHEKKNRLMLNKNGMLAAEHAGRILEMAERMLEDVRYQDRAMGTVVVGASLTGALVDSVRLLKAVYPEMSVSTEILSDSGALVQGLKEQAYQMIILDHCPKDPDLYAQRCGAVHMCVALPPAHRCAGLGTITFADLNGESLLISSFAPVLIRELYRKLMPDSRFIPIDGNDIRLIAGASSMCAMTSDVAARLGDPWGERIVKPIASPEAETPYYGVCLSAYREKFRLFFEKTAG